MKRFLVLGACWMLGVAMAAEGLPKVVVQREVHPEAENLLTPEALERYSAPGKVSRYKALAEQLKIPVEELPPPAINLRMPVQSWPNGRTKTMIYAKEAWIATDMMSIRGRNVRVVQLSETGTAESELEAKEVQIDRTTMLAVVSGPLSGHFGSDHLSGRGALIDFNAHYLKVLQSAKITTRRTGDVDFTSRGMF